MKVLSFVLISFAIASIGVHAQGNARAEGIALLQQKKFPEAEKKLLEYTESNPNDFLGWTYLGHSLVGQQNYDKAIIAYKRSLEGDIKFSQQKNEPYFQIARCYSALNDKGHGMEYLKLLATNKGGIVFSKKIEKDKLFEVMKGEPELAQIKESMTMNSFPCMYDPNSKKLWFFIGIWDVYVQGRTKDYDVKVGADSVRRQPGGCSIFENFTYFQPPGLGIPDYKGWSLSFFDPAKQKFIHSWTGSAGDIINYEEIASGENTLTLLATTNSGSTGGLMHRRFRFDYNPADETIHQFIENSFDLGKTWTKDWDAVFKKKK